MEISKKAQQKNVLLNKDYYNLEEINKLLKARKICYFENLEECFWSVENLYDYDFRIFTCDLKEIKVVLDDDGYYATIAIDNNNNSYYVVL